MWKFVYIIIDFCILISIIIILKYVILKIKGILHHYKGYNKVFVIQDDINI